MWGWAVIKYCGPERVGGGIFRGNWGKLGGKTREKEGKSHWIFQFSSKSWAMARVTQVWAVARGPYCLSYLVVRSVRIVRTFSGRGFEVKFLGVKKHTIRVFWPVGVFSPNLGPIMRSRNYASQLWGGPASASWQRGVLWRWGSWGDSGSTNEGKEMSFF